MIKNKMADTVEPIDKPRLPTHAFIDADPIAYAGAFSAEKRAYQWVYKDTREEASEVFNKAVDAKEWAVTFEMCGNDIESIERITLIIMKTEQDAHDACDEVIKDYLKTAEKICGKEPIIRGYLTPSGSGTNGVMKVKDIVGLENRYQFNRYEKDGVTFKPKPTYLSSCRTHIINKYSWIRMAESGYEADTHVIAMAEKKKDRGLIMSIDKDLNQGENTWYVNMNDMSHQRQPKFATPLGELWEVTNARGEISIKGDGFMWLCLQAVCGDTSDGYKGLSMYGEKTAYKDLKDSKTKQECVQILKRVYDKKLLKGQVCKEAKKLKIGPKAGHIKYLSWDNKRVKLSVIELMQQHFFLAYQERSNTDVFNVEYYLQEEKDNV